MAVGRGKWGSVVGALLRAPSRVSRPRSCREPVDSPIAESDSGSGIDIRYVAVRQVCRFTCLCASLVRQRHLARRRHRTAGARRRGDRQKPSAGCCTACRRLRPYDGPWVRRSYCNNEFITSPTFPTHQHVKTNERSNQRTRISHVTAKGFAFDSH